jgi:hypothetical protein
MVSGVRVAPTHAEEASMQRLFAFVLIGLSVAVAVAAAPGAWQASGPAYGQAGTNAADPAVGYAFYRALDRVLAGEGDSLSEIVTADFVDHADAEAAGLPAETLVDRLQALGQAIPGAHLRVERVRASGNMLVAVVTPVMPASSQVAGATVSTEAPAGGIEILGVERGRVSERWAAPLPPPLVTSFEAATLGGSSDITLTARLFRITLSAGQGLRWRGDVPALAMVEAGTVSMTTLEYADDLSIHQPTSAGTAVSVPQGAVLRATSSDQSAQLLFFSVQPVASSVSGTFQLEGGTTSELLWKSTELFELAGPWSISAGLIALPPERGVELGKTGGRAMILAAQGGPLLISTGDGMLSRLGERFRMAAVDAPATLSPGEAMQALNAGSVTLESTSDRGALVWMIGFGPIAPEGGGAGLLPERPGEGDELPAHLPHPLK